MTRTLLLALAAALLLPACATNTLMDETSTETDVKWSKARVVDVAVDKTGTLHVVIESDNNEYFVFGAHQSKLGDGLTRCYMADELESGGRIPDSARSDAYQPPTVTLEKDESGNFQIVLAPADGSVAGKSDMAAKTRTRGAGGWVALALLSPVTVTIDVAMKAKQLASPAMLIKTVGSVLTPEEAADPTNIPRGCTCDRPEAQ